MLILCTLLISSISACVKDNSTTLRSGTYTLQGVERDVPGDFTITIYDDGTFQCYETPISSFIRNGSANYHFVPLEEGASLVWTSDVP